MRLGKQANTGSAGTVAIIPALNEAGSIGAVLCDLPRASLARTIVVDNGSRDATAAIAARHGAEVVYEPRRGYGFACMAGVAAAPEASLYLFLDGDYSDYPDEAGALVAPILAGRADVVLGTRMLRPEARAALPPAARAGNRLASRLIRARYDVRVTDLAPFKAVSGDALRRLALQERTYGWTIELIVRAVQQRLRIQEVPVRYRRRLAGESKVSGNLPGTLRASARILTTLARPEAQQIALIQRSRVPLDQREACR
jgi:glycosyltransferase involved in cell wall biosynthesis